MDDRSRFHTVPTLGSAPPTKERERSPVDCELEQIDMAIKDLVGTLSVHEARLGPVMTPQGPSPGSPNGHGTVVAAPSGSLLLERLQGQRRELRVLLGRLTELTSRLEV